MKHKITINVADRHGNKTEVLKGAEMKLPTRLARLLFGGFTQVYLLSPGQTVESVDVREIKEGEKNMADKSEAMKELNVACRALVSDLAIICLAFANALNAELEATAKSPTTQEIEIPAEAVTVEDTPAETESVTSEEEDTATAEAVSEDAPTEAEITLSEIRAFLAEKSRAGFTDEVKELLKAHGSSKLSSIDPPEYAAIMKSANKKSIGK